VDSMAMLGAAIRRVSLTIRRTRRAVRCCRRRTALDSPAIRP
jgi:hypothetical protein